MRERRLSLMVLLMLCIPLLPRNAVAMRDGDVHTAVVLGGSGEGAPVGTPLPGRPAAGTGENNAPVWMMAGVSAVAVAVAGFIGGRKKE